MKQYNWEKNAHEIINNVSQARAYVIKAIATAKINNFSEAYNNFDYANQKINAIENIDDIVIEKDVDKQTLKHQLLYLHAQDQLSSVKSLVLMAKEIVAIYSLLDSRPR